MLSGISACIIPWVVSGDNFGAQIGAPFIIYHCAPQVTLGCVVCPKSSASVPTRLGYICVRMQLVIIALGLAPRTTIYMSTSEESRRSHVLPVTRPDVQVDLNPQVTSGRCKVLFLPPNMYGTWDVDHRERRKASEERRAG